MSQEHSSPSAPCSGPGDLGEGAASSQSAGASSPAAGSPPLLFTPLEREAWGGFIRAQGVLFRAIEEDLRARVGITHPEFEVLLRLWLRPGNRARIQELAQQSLLTRSGTSRLVERLERSGLLARADAAEDGRGIYAQLTVEGQRLFEVAAVGHVALVRSLFLQHFSAEEQALLGTLWRRIPPLPAAPASSEQEPG